MLHRVCGRAIALTIMMASQSMDVSAQTSPPLCDTIDATSCPLVRCAVRDVGECTQVTTTSSPTPFVSTEPTTNAPTAQPSCFSILTQTECEAVSTCAWTSDSYGFGTCGDRSTVSASTVNPDPGSHPFQTTSQTVPPPVVDTTGPGGSVCFVFLDQASCERAVPSCQWNTDNGTGFCEADSNGTPDTVPTVASTTSGTPNPTSTGLSCFSIGDQAACEAAAPSCQWSTDYGFGFCEDMVDSTVTVSGTPNPTTTVLSCFSFSDQAACEAAPSCQWSTSYGFGFCDVDSQSSSTEASTEPTTSNGPTTSGIPDCFSLFTQVDCEAITTCQWTESYGFGFCDARTTEATTVVTGSPDTSSQPLSCFTFFDQAACEAVTGCTWTTAYGAGFCESASGNVTTTQPTQSTTPPGPNTTQPIQCFSFGTEAECVANGTNCQWDATFQFCDVRGSTTPLPPAVCTVASTQAACAQLPGCTFVSRQECYDPNATTTTTVTTSTTLSTATSVTTTVSTITTSTSTMSTVTTTISTTTVSATTRTGTTRTTTLTPQTTTPTTTPIDTAGVTVPFSPAPSAAPTRLLTVDVAFNFFSILEQLPSSDTDAFAAELSLMVASQINEPTFTVQLRVAHITSHQIVLSIPLRARDTMLSTPPSQLTFYFDGTRYAVRSIGLPGVPATDAPTATPTPSPPPTNPPETASPVTPQQSASDDDGGLSDGVIVIIVVIAALAVIAAMVIAVTHYGKAQEQKQLSGHDTDQFQHNGHTSASFNPMFTNPPPPQGPYSHHTSHNDMPPPPGWGSAASPSHHQPHYHPPPQLYQETMANSQRRASLELDHLAAQRRGGNVTVEDNDGFGFDT
eukprot:m.58608 g.58608  ORF g.58608 m.58608 type:complete len:851 (+) comp7832_c0_seq1:53-2605(+)